MSDVNALRAQREQIDRELAAIDGKDRRYRITQLADRAIRSLRDLEDYCRMDDPRMESPNGLIADRARDIYEQIRTRILEGSTTPQHTASRLSPPAEALMKSQEELEAELELVRQAATIHDPARWPLRDFLPMKREGGDAGIQNGYLIRGDLCCVRRQDAEDDRYDSVDEMLDDGWRVD